MITLQNLDELWDLYTQKKFKDVLNFYPQLEEEIHKLNENLKELYFLCLIEINSNIKIPQTNGIFKELLSGMLDYHNNNYNHSSSKLAKWLLNKDFYADWMLDRFYEVAKKAKHYQLIINVCKNFIQKKVMNTRIIKELFYAYYHLREFEEAFQCFEKYREVFDENDLQLVGITLLKLRKYKDAERILLSVYKKITGKEYQIQYEKYETYYKNQYKLLKEKFIKNQIQDDKELTEYAMSCLFNNDYRTALQIFLQLKNKLLKVA